MFVRTTPHGPTSARLIARDGEETLVLTGFTMEQASVLRDALAKCHSDGWDVLLTYEEAGEALGISARTLRRRVAQGVIPHRRSPNGRMVRFSRRDIERIKELAHQEASPRPRGPASPGAMTQAGAWLFTLASTSLAIAIGGGWRVPMVPLT